MAEVIFGFPPSIPVDFSGGFEIRRKSSSPSVRQSSTFEFGEAESGCVAGSYFPWPYFASTPYVGGRACG